MSERALLRIREYIERAQQALLRKIWDAEEYDIPTCITCRDMVWLKASEVKGSDEESEW